MLLAKFPDDSGDDSDQHEHEKDLNEAAREPVVAFALVQDDLHAAKTQTDQADADVIDAEALFDLSALHVGRIADQQRRKQQRKNAYRDIDVKNPAPGKIVGDPAAEPGADGRRDDDGDTVHGESHAALFQRKCVVQDGLLAWLQTDAAHSLQNAAETANAEARGQAS